MTIAFSLKKMEEIYQDAYNYYNNYKNSLSEINDIIYKLEKYWKSDETKSYEEFMELYKEKQTQLLTLQDLMKQFCQTISEKKDLFKESTNDAITNFE